MIPLVIIDRALDSLLRSGLINKGVSIKLHVLLNLISPRNLVKR